MTTSHSNAFAGAYADLRFVKSRKVAQVVIELPIEEANRFLSAFGAPDPSQERWVGLAPLNIRPAQEDLPEPDEKPRRQFNELRPSARAAIMCKEAAFWVFLKVDGESQAIAKLKRHCGIDSRRELDQDETKRMKFEMTERDYQRWREEKHF